MAAAGADGGEASAFFFFGPFLPFFFASMLRVGWRTTEAMGRANTADGTAKAEASGTKASGTEASGTEVSGTKASGTKASSIET